MKNKEKTYSEEEVSTELAKSMYKVLKKALEGRKKESDEVISDILDPNYVAEVDPDKIPSGRKVSVLNKNEDKLLNFKGIEKLKHFLEKRKQLK